MKPVQLKIRGFTAFRDETVVDFTDRRLFVITGPTGAGKSSLLDAMTWALYGQVPRVGRSVKELVSQGERDMSVLFEFTVRGKGYRVARRYPGNVSARLERLVDGEWRSMDQRTATEVTHEVESLLGMDYATFTRAIVLPQGDFDSFLRGDAKDRRAILSQLIGLRVYDEAGKIARARAALHKTQAETIRTQLEKLPLATPEVIANLAAREAQLTKESESLTARRAALVHLRELATTDREHQQAIEHASTTVREAEAALVEAQRALADATCAVEERTKAVARIEAEQAKLKYDPAEHDRLKAAVAVLDQRAAAEAALTQVRADLDAAKQAMTAADEAKRAAESRAKEAVAGLQAAEKSERTAETALAKAAGRAARVLERLQANAAAAEAAATEADTSARGLAERIRELTSLQQSLASAEADLTQAQDASKRVEQERAASAKAAKQASKARAKAEEQALAARAALDAARAEDAASHLRAGLKVGDPCPVCGEPIAKLGKHDAPNLARVEAALAAAEADLTHARRDAEQSAAALAAAEARVEETARALAAVEAHRSALTTQLAEHDVAADSLPRAIEEGQREAARLTESVEAKRTEAREHLKRAQALRESLARVPSAIEATEVKRAPADAEAVQEELASALVEYAEAVEGARTAERAATAATSAADACTRDAEVAARDVAKAETAVEQAEQRLSSLGGVEGDPARVRKDLARAEEQATRQRELAASLATEREALASAEASRKGAATSQERSAEAVTKRREECQAAEARATEARTALTSAWRETIGEGEPSLRSLRAVMEAFEVDRDRVQEALTTTRNSREQAAAQVAQAEAMRADADEHTAAGNLVGSVGLDLQGNRFIAYLLNESMQLLATDASDRLSTFTNGRYALVAKDDAFLVVDHLNGDEERSVRTLSGGETFLASLALALALSEHLPEISGTGGAVSLDSLFLDEGFGALDAEALDLAVQGLETLAEGSRMIGVISHVEELSDRLPDRIRVEKGSHGSIVVA